FLMIWGQHYFFSSWVIFMPILLYSIEVWLRTKKWAYLAFTIAYFSLNIALLYQALIFSTAYLGFRLLIDNHKPWKKETIFRVLTYFGIVALGMSLSAAFWLPEYYLIKSNPRISADL